METIFIFIILFISLFNMPINKSHTSLTPEQFLRIQTQMSGWANINRVSNIVVKSSKTTIFYRPKEISGHTFEVYKLPYQMYRSDSSATGVSTQIDDLQGTYLTDVKGKVTYVRRPKLFMRGPLFASEIASLQSLENNRQSPTSYDLSEEVFQGKPVYKLTITPNVGPSLGMNIDLDIRTYYYDKTNYMLLAFNLGDYSTTLYEGWHKVDGFSVPSKMILKKGFVKMGDVFIDDFKINQPLDYSKYFAQAR